MITWEAALRQRLLDDPGVRAIAGAQVSWRWRAQADPLPGLTLRLISDPRPQTLAGLQGHRQSRVQIDCWADGGTLSQPQTRATVIALREAAIAAVLPPMKVGGVSFGRGLIADPGPRDLGEQTDTGFIHREQFDLLVMHD